METEMDVDLFDEIVQLSLQVKFLIYTTGGMATKTAVENAVMQRLGLTDRYLPHIAQNHIEQANIVPWRNRLMSGGYDWTGQGERPLPSDWPEINWKGCRCDLSRVAASNEYIRFGE